METIEAGGLVWRIVRSSRKTICLRIGADGMPEILAPARLAQAEILRFAEKYAPEMAGQREKKLAQLAAREAFSLEYGGELRVLGGTRTLTEGRAGYVSFTDTAYLVPPGLSGEALLYAVSEAYKLHARAYLPPRAAELAEAMGLHPPVVKVNSARSHWGSCSARGTLNIAWYTMMARSSAVDYILIHELCHTKHFDHSPAFWAEVARWCPAYEAEKEYLAELWSVIARESWN